MKFLPVLDVDCSANNFEKEIEEMNPEDENNERVELFYLASSAASLSCLSVLNQVLKTVKMDKIGNDAIRQSMSKCQTTKSLEAKKITNGNKKISTESSARKVEIIQQPEIISLSSNSEEIVSYTEQNDNNIEKIFFVDEVADDEFLNNICNSQSGSSINDVNVLNCYGKVELEHSEVNIPVMKLENENLEEADVVFEEISCDVDNNNTRPPTPKQYLDPRKNVPVNQLPERRRTAQHMLSGNVDTLIKQNKSFCQVDKSAYMKYLLPFMRSTQIADRFHRLKGYYGALERISVVENHLQTTKNLAFLNRSVPELKRLYEKLDRAQRNKEFLYKADGVLKIDGGKWTRNGDRYLSYRSQSVYDIRRIWMNSNDKKLLQVKKRAAPPPNVKFKTSWRQIPTFKGLFQTSSFNVSNYLIRGISVNNLVGKFNTVIKEERVQVKKDWQQFSSKNQEQQDDPGTLGNLQIDEENESDDGKSYFSSLGCPPPMRTQSCLNLNGRNPPPFRHHQSSKSEINKLERSCIYFQKNKVKTLITKFNSDANFQPTKSKLYQSQPNIKNILHLHSNSNNDETDKVVDWLCDDLEKLHSNCFHRNDFLARREYCNNNQNDRISRSEQYLNLLRSGGKSQNNIYRTESGPGKIPFDPVPNYMSILKDSFHTAESYICDNNNNDESTFRTMDVKLFSPRNFNRSPTKFRRISCSEENLKRCSSTDAALGFNRSYSNSPLISYTPTPSPKTILDEINEDQYIWRPSPPPPRRHVPSRPLPGQKGHNK